MKNQKTTLALLLGCVLAVTAVAGGVAWNRTRKGMEDETDNYISLEETTEDFLWNTPISEGQKEDVPETTTDTEEETKEVQSLLEVPATKAPVQEPDQGKEPEMEKVPETDVPVAMEQALALNFSTESRLSWPLEGEVF